MNWRRLFTSLVVLIAIALVVTGYVLYERWTDPAVVRAAVLEELSERFPGAEVRLGSARLSLFGGIELTDLELTRRDQPDAPPLAVLPAVTLRHDKEALGSGRLVIRKIEIRDPQVTVVRDVRGDWNFDGLVGERPADGPMPTIEIQRGRITVLDQKCDNARFELSDAQFTLTPGEAGRHLVKGSATSGVFGPVSLEGTTRIPGGDANLALKAPRILLNSAFFKQLNGYLAICEPGGLELEGNASLEADLSYSPRAEQPWSTQFALRLRDSQVRHPRFPLPLEQVNASIRSDGTQLILERLEGRSHGANVLVTGKLQGLSADSDFELQVKAEHLKITREIYEKLPPQIARLGADFNPEGCLSLVSTVRQVGGKFTANYTATLHGMAILYRDFPYPVEAVSGTLAYQDDGDAPELIINLTGLASRRPVKVTGKVFGRGLRPDSDFRTGFQLEITGSNLPIDERFLRALPELSQRVARQFKPTGLVDVRAELRRMPAPASARPVLEQHHVLHFHDASLCYEKFPYPVEDVTGTLELFDGGRWTFTGFKARHKQGQFTGHAKSTPTEQGDRIEINVTGTHALLDAEMEAALSQRIRATYRLFNPAGRVDFLAKVGIVGARPPDLDLHVTARGCTMKPSCFPYQLTNVTGAFHFAKERVTLSEFRARHGDAAIRLGREGDGGEVLLRPGGGFRADLRQIHAWPLTIDQEFLQAVPPLVRRAFETLQPDRPVRIITDLVIDDPGRGGKVKYDWNGHVAFADTRLHCGFPLEHVTGIVACRGHFDGLEMKADGNVLLDQLALRNQVFRDVRGEMKLTQQALVFPGLRAAVHGGEIYGPIRVEFTPEPTYRLDLTASQIDLEKFARETLGRSGQVQGKASARLELTGRGNDWNSLRGAGWVRIPEAKLYDLPLVLDLLSALSGHLPKDSAFQEAYADFVVQGERLRIARLELLGDAISLRGTGDVRVDGDDLKLQLYGLLWGRTMPLLPPIIDKIPPWLSKRLMQIRVEGSLEKAKTKIEPLPDLVEPLKEMLKTVRNRQGMQPGSPRPSP
jgi:hypothetical protein